MLPYEQGGLSIQLLGLMNAALGMKIVWILITGNKRWWKKSLINKYLNGSKENLLNGNIPIRQSTQVWKLVKRVIPIMGSRISKTPGNGQKISIAEDITMGKDPLQDHPEMDGIQEWMRGKGFNTLHSISLWNQKEWKEWKRPAIRANMEGQWNKLKQHLKGASPIHRDEEDNYLWDPSNGQYTVKTGYKILQDQTNQQEWEPWKIAWKSESLPKIKNFIWTLLKGKILTSENLKRKRGFHGPSRCPLCQQVEETIQHLFQDYKFSRECWE